MIKHDIQLQGTELNQVLLPLLIDSVSMFCPSRVNKRQSSTVTTLTAHRRMAHQAPFVNGVTKSSWWWHSPALGRCPLASGGLDSGQGGPVVSTAQ